MKRDALQKQDSLSQKWTFRLLALFQILLAAVIVLFANIKYEVSDDFIMEMLLSGTYTGEPDVHILFANDLWGWCLLPLYKLFPGISWYFWAQMLVCLLSYLAICYVLAYSTRWYTAVFSAVTITAFTAMDLYMLPQFTKTATTAVVAGSMLFLWALFHRRSLVCVLLGGALALAGTWIRFAVIYIAAPSVLIYLVYQTVCLFREQGWTVAKVLKQIYAPGVLLLALVFASSMVTEIFYTYDDDYSYCYAYSAARAAIVDYAYPEYAQCADALAEIGISENDYNLILNWSFGDPEVFSLEKLQQVGQVLEQYRAEQPFSLMGFLRHVLIRRPMFYPGAVCCILLGLYCLLLNWKKVWIPAVSAVLIIGFFMGFFTVGRNVYRVEFGYFFSAAVLIACVCQDALPALSPNVKRGSLITAAVCLLLQAVCYFPDTAYQQLNSDQYREYIDETFYYSWCYDADKYRKIVRPGEVHPNFLQEVTSNPDKIYVLDFNTSVQSLYYNFSPRDSAAKVFPTNLHFLGGVTIHHPAVTEPLNDLGFDGLLDALVEDSVYFVSNVTADMVLTYLKEHGYPNAQCQLYATIDGYNIWKYSG